MIVDILNEAGAFVGYDSHSVPIVDQDGDTIASTGTTQNLSFGLKDVFEEEVAGHWILCVKGTDGSLGYWDESAESWVAGTPN